MNTSPIKRAVQSVGSNAALAIQVGVSPGMVSQWVSGKRPVAATRCAAIETATKGAVTRYELRPDVFGDADVQDGRDVA